MKIKKIAIVTGAAKGLGKAISVRLSSDNCFVYLVDIDDENGIALEHKIGKARSKYIR